MAARFLRSVARFRRVSKRSIIYVDGFNFYYGAVRGTSHKWLNLERLFERLHPDDEIQVFHRFCRCRNSRRRCRTDAAVL